VQVELSSSYSSSDWCDGLKSIRCAAGEPGTPTLSHFSDAQIKDETMIQDISSLLSHGEVPILCHPIVQATLSVSLLLCNTGGAIEQLQPR
jgi:hypothetical protein